MFDEATLEYLKKYENCKDYCLEEQDCIDDLKSKYENICLTEEPECSIIETPEFKNLIEFLIKFIRFLYCIRSYHNNVYDTKIITSLSKLNLDRFGLTLDQLSCVDFPGNGTFAPGFPHILSEYFKIITAIASDPTDPNRKTIMEKYKNFCDDFQPWSRMLATFLKIHAARLFPRLVIPNIEKPKLYGTFIIKRALTKREFDKLLLLDNFSESLIYHIEKENTPIRSITRTKSLPTNKSKSRSRPRTRRIRSRIRTI